MRNGSLAIRSSSFAVKCCIGSLAALFFCAIVFFATPSLVPPKVERYELERKSDPLDDALSRSVWPDDAHPPTTTIDVHSSFGQFRIPLGNYLYRRQLAKIGFFRSKSVEKPDTADAKLFVETFGFDFWMPDGGVVATEAASLMENMIMDPLTWERRRMPLLPLESGRPDPSSHSFVVAVATFCPSANARPHWPDDGAGAMLGATPVSVMGYAYGAMEMLACWEERPGPSWSTVPPSAPGGPTMFCRPDEEAACFGWVDVPATHNRALVYMPKDAVPQAGAVAEKLRALLQHWRMPDGSADPQGVHGP